MLRHVSTHAQTLQYTRKHSRQHFCSHTHTLTLHTTLPNKTHMHTRCDRKKPTHLLKSVCKQVFGRTFSMGGRRLNKLPAEDQQRLSAWHTHQLKRTNCQGSVQTTHLHQHTRTHPPTHTHSTYIRLVSTSFFHTQTTHIQNVDQSKTRGRTVITSALMTTQDFVSLQPIYTNLCHFRARWRQITAMGVRSNKSFLVE